MSGFTAVPRWTLDPAPGVGEREARIPDGLAAALRRLAGEVPVPLSTVLLAAHAKVLGALAGEREVCTGYATNANAALPLRMTLAPRTWRELLRATARTEPGPAESLFETEFELTSGDCGEPGAGVVLRVAVVEHDGLRLRLRYKKDALDADSAARISFSARCSRDFAVPSGMPRVVATAGIGRSR